MKKDAIGSRIKANYEDRYRFSLTRRTPVIMRLDGRAFHSVTRSCKKPFDDQFAEAMDNTAMYLCTEIQGAKCAYVQSDEISILITDFDKLTTEAWFDYNIQKMVSVSAGMASAHFSNSFGKGIEFITFDSRVFNIPVEEVTNYFVWRQKDWIRNSVQMLAQAHFSHKELHGKNQEALHDMLHGIGVNWADLPRRWKNGRFLSKTDESATWNWNTSVIFTQHRAMVEQFFLPSDIAREPQRNTASEQVSETPGLHASEGNDEIPKHNASDRTVETLIKIASDGEGQ